MYNVLVTEYQIYNKKLRLFSVVGSFFVYGVVHSLRRRPLHELVIGLVEQSSRLTLSLNLKIVKSASQTQYF